MNIETALVLSILQKWQAFTWTVQGFGFIRTKIQNVGRIHVWDSALMVPRVSTMHTHPWPLRSTIISGELVNQRFIESEYGRLPYLRSRIATGEGGGLIDAPEVVQLIGGSPEAYSAGNVYEQAAHEIHRSIPQDGTVTLMTRPQGPPLEEALVYWPRGTAWVSAEPRKAQDYEVDRVISYALSRWAPHEEVQS